MRTDLPADLAELTSRPPVFRLLGVAEKVHGKHLNHVWKGLAGVPWLDEPAIPVFAKFLPRPTQIDIELACGLASQALRLPVPRPALVIAELEDLQSPPASLKDGPIILFGSLFQPPDPFFARKADDDALATEFIWQKVCDDEVAPKGAAWDELVANPDRHAQNLLFDGSKWWLFDHNLALQPLARLYQTLDKDSTQRTIIGHIAKVNQILAQLTERRRADQSVLAEADRMLRQGKKLTLLAREVRKWKVDSRIDPIFTISATIIDLIALRLQPLALYIEQRLDVPAGESLWSNS
ncbi:hypothetical protein SAMN05216550_113214 [Paraburkholderia tropica]|uniref:Uncharacterized protein n=2 Tax=Paraburkholderia tropica TaxID=92647 RepID=A0AAQ1GJ59_9BURK|nr:hypothetical protein SAMN05216550_113214 [Paraburkholderia tropica]